MNERRRGRELGIADKYGCYSDLWGTVGKSYEGFVCCCDEVAIHSLLETYRNRLVTGTNIGRRDS
jgi:hypothetical protein